MSFLKRTYCRILKMIRPRFYKATNKSIVDHLGVRLFLGAKTISPYIRKVVYSGGYERKEALMLQATIEPGDRVLELGSGMGFIACYSAKLLGDSAAVHAVEALPHMEAVIRKNFELNGIKPGLTMAAVGPSSGETEFAAAENFWSSAQEAHYGKEKMIRVPMVALYELIQMHKPTYLVVDVEGAEKDLFTCDLGPVSKICLEIHPHYIGDTGVHKALTDLYAQGFVIDFSRIVKGVLYLYRANAAKVSEAL